MTRWALIVKSPSGAFAQQIDEVTGTREQALAALWHHAHTFKTPQPMNLTRRTVCKDGDDGYVVVNWGLTRMNHIYEFRMHELLWEWSASNGAW
ncbi:hypothetical protein [Streptomyces odontomachi]|uniref:hypothetical protein n=1 Tax=Streptomyces odontomachi TaxID=2944940 RepID=UPI00210CA3CE|nr:hypothetical protein [Streptomyces sp. ODS25]